MRNYCDSNYIFFNQKLNWIFEGEYANSKSKLGIHTLAKLSHLTAVSVHPSTINLNGGRDVHRTANVV